MDCELDGTETDKIGFWHEKKKKNTEIFFLKKALNGAKRTAQYRDPKDIGG